MAGKDIIVMSLEELRRLSVVRQVLGKYIPASRGDRYTRSL
jgi:hypothetical protein